MPEFREALKEGVQKLSKAAARERGPLKKGLVKLYLSSPPKVQVALAKFGLKNVVKRKKIQLQEMLKH